MATTIAQPEPATTSGYHGAERPQWEDYSKCIHCGLCLTDCPTYRLLGLEMDSPRGRIHQMILVDEGRLKIADPFVRHIDLCLDCRACETTCPSGVPYGKLVEAARAQIAQSYRRPLPGRWLRNLGLRYVLPNPRRLAFAGRLLRFYQRSGLQMLVRRSRLLKLFGRLEQVERLLPAIETRFFFDRIGQVFPAEGPRRIRVAFFAGCVANIAFSELNEATIRVLQKNGCEVVVPEGQGCCGALHVHTGLRAAARELARVNLEVFLREAYDAVVTNAAGCGSTLKEYHLLFADEPQWREKARIFAARVQDVTEFLVTLGLRQDMTPLRLRVTYQDPCHLVHGQRICQAPRELLQAIPGLELVEMKLADHCCGSAGIYNVLHPEVSWELLREKLECARATGANVIATANPGCMLQLRAGVDLYGTGQEVLHVVELLDRTYTSTANKAEPEH